MVLGFCAHGSDQIVERGLYVCVLEDEAELHGTSGYHATAFQDEFHFGAEHEGADTEHPLRDIECHDRLEAFAQFAHQAQFAHRMWRGEIDDALC